MRSTLVTLANLLSAATTVNHTNTVASVIRILRTTRLLGLPVIADGQFVGLVTPRDVLGEPPYRRIADVMQTGIRAGTSDMLPSDGLRLVTSQGLDLLPVIDDSRVVGVVSAVALLAALNQPTDALTGLPWAVSLRRWASERLLEGREIAILFLDLDNFWLVNKVSGHVAGDECLRAAAHMLAACVDPGTDILCRYGGDEFAIGTTRRDADLEALVRRVRGAVDVLVDLKGSAHRVRASVGVAGGRRAATRADAHIASLIEDVIGQASLASTLAKGSERWESVAARTFRPMEAAISRRSLEGRCRLVDVAVKRIAEDHCTASVTLELGQRVAVQSANPSAESLSLSKAVATATLQAIMDLAGPGHTLSLHDEMEIVAADNTPISVVTVQRHETLERWVGAASAPHRIEAVARATLAAVNRRLARVLGDVIRRRVTRGS